MALKATVFKASLQIADLDRNYYQDHQLTLARHPSETDERLLVRLLAFALHADEQLQFTKGLCAEDEAELWQRNDTGEIELWIEVGLPDEGRLRKACGRARQVVLYAYGGRAVPLWWQRNADKLRRFDNLRIYALAEEQTRPLAALAERFMEFQLTIQDGQVFLNCGANSLLISPQQIFPAD